MAQLKNANLTSTLKKPTGEFNVFFDFGKTLTPRECNRLYASIRRFGEISSIEFKEDLETGITHVFVYMARTQDGQLLADYITGVIKKIPSKAHTLSAQFPQLYVVDRSPSAKGYQVSLDCEGILSHGEQQNACAAFLHTFGEVAYLYMAEDYRHTKRGFVSVHYKDQKSADELIKFITPGN